MRQKAARSPPDGLSLLGNVIAALEAEHAYAKILEAHADATRLELGKVDTRLTIAIRASQRQESRIRSLEARAGVWK